jgi:hypothetical protein
VWLKEKRSTPQGEFNYSVNVQATNPLGGCRAFAFMSSIPLAAC